MVYKFPDKNLYEICNQLRVLMYSLVWGYYFKSSNKDMRLVLDSGGTGIVLIIQLEDHLAHLMSDFCFIQIWLWECSVVYWGFMDYEM